jgi:hypothetical protein
MGLSPPIDTTLDCSTKVKLMGRLAVACNAFTVFGILLVDYQSGGHGEMGSFYRANMVWILLFSSWGLATGIGLLRAWRWARISALIFSGLLVALGVLAVVALLRMPAGDVSGWQLLMLRAFAVLFFLSPAAVGTWWLLFFNRQDVKAYFSSGSVDLAQPSSTVRGCQGEQRSTPISRTVI